MVYVVIAIEWIVRSEPSIMQEKVPYSDFIFAMIVAFRDPLHPWCIQVKQPHVI